jgi:hypothetical protein
MMSQYGTLPRDPWRFPTYRAEMQNQMSTTINVANWYNAGHSFSIFDDA